MYIDVVFSPNEFESRDYANKSITVIDVLRATTTIIYALNSYDKSNGCCKIMPVETLEEARALAKSFNKNDILLTGERFCLKPEDFDMGNSPKDYISSKVKDKIIIYSTTNGTRALNMAKNAKFITTSSFVNASASVGILFQEKNDIIILCAGRSNKTTTEDSVCAGLITSLLMKKCIENNIKYKLSDSSNIAFTYFNHYKNNLHKLLRDSEAGNNLIEVNLEDDIEDCLKIDKFNTATQFKNGIITTIDTK